MRPLIFAAAALFFVACGQQQPGVSAAPSATPEAPRAAAPPSASIDGWEIDQTAYAKIGTALPTLSGTRPDGSAFTTESLRGRWTILGLWPEGPPPTEEPAFATALNSAVDQDPDLDLLIIHQAAPAYAEQWPWPLVIDDETIAAAISAPTLPAYLLIGPDLTIEGYRSALSETPDDGIKPVVRGVSEIRTQIAAPQ